MLSSVFAVNESTETWLTGHWTHSLSTKRVQHSLLSLQQTCTTISRLLLQLFSWYSINCFYVYLKRKSLCVFWHEISKNLTEMLLKRTADNRYKKNYVNYEITGFSISLQIILSCNWIFQIIFCWNAHLIVAIKLCYKNISEHKWTDALCSLSVLCWNAVLIVVI